MGRKKTLLNHGGGGGKSGSTWSALAVGSTAPTLWFGGKCSSCWDGRISLTVVKESQRKNSKISLGDQFPDRFHCSKTSTVHSSTVALNPARSSENIRFAAGRKSHLQYHGDFCSHSQRIHGGAGMVPHLLRWCELGMESVM
jgi:hypothetical protein